MCVLQILLKTFVVFIKQLSNWAVFSAINVTFGLKNYPNAEKCSISSYGLLLRLKISKSFPHHIRSVNNFLHFVILVTQAQILKLYNLLYCCQ